jgi:hypothetical protein
VVGKLLGIRAGRTKSCEKGLRENQADEPATQSKNYITPSGLQRLKDEHRFLLTRERPAVTEVVAWAASRGDRSGAAAACRIDSRCFHRTYRLIAPVCPREPRL